MEKELFKKQFMTYLGIIFWVIVISALLLSVIYQTAQCVSSEDNIEEQLEFDPSNNPTCDNANISEEMREQICGGNTEKRDMFRFGCSVGCADYSLRANNFSWALVDDDIIHKECVDYCYDN